jgi:hypothetical protein
MFMGISLSYEINEIPSGKKLYKNEQVIEESDVINIVSNSAFIF